jgi:hypothetical protein
MIQVDKQEKLIHFETPIFQKKQFFKNLPFLFHVNFLHDSNQVVDTTHEPMQRWQIIPSCPRFRT